jgi:hypothetical protein
MHKHDHGVVLVAKITTLFNFAYWFLLYDVSHIYQNLRRLEQSNKVYIEVTESIILNLATPYMSQKVLFSQEHTVMYSTVHQALMLRIWSLRDIDGAPTTVVFTAPYPTAPPQRKIACMK